eukprot:4660639-Amphidinium_carterae.1
MLRATSSPQADLGRWMHVIQLVLALLKRAGKRALGADRWAYTEVLALVRPGDTRGPSSLREVQDSQ